MKLITYDNRKRVSRYSTDDASVRISIKIGTFNFNRTACNLLKLNAGDTIEFANEEESKKDWYVRKAIAGKGFILRSVNTNSASLNSAVTARDITATCGITSKNFVLKINEKPVNIAGDNYYLLITKPIMEK